MQTCGNAQLNCCNKIEKQGDTKNAGVLGSLFGSGDIGLQCTPINLPIAAREYLFNSIGKLLCGTNSVFEFSPGTC